MIRTETITYSIIKKKKFSEQLTKRLSFLEEVISTTPTIDFIEEYSLLKTEIDNMHEELAQGAIIRSRCRHLDI